ncbi:MAG: hypothetical protein J5859_04150 [Clostridia bacterium]|nr:hypothetical protein [Clostridia bacterium]
MKVLRKAAFSILAAAAACAGVFLFIRRALPGITSMAMPAVSEQLAGLTRADISWSACALLLIPSLFFAGRLPQSRPVRILITAAAVLFTVLTVRINAIPLPAAIKAAVRVISSL